MSVLLLHIKCQFTYISQKHIIASLFPVYTCYCHHVIGGLVFPASFMHSKDKEGNAVMSAQPRDLFTEENFRKFERSWDDGRIPTAFFRGQCYIL